MTSVATVGGVIPRYIYHYCDSLNVQTRHTVAFQATCRCGWSGKWQESRSVAVDDYQSHKREHESEGS